MAALEALAASVQTNMDMEAMPAPVQRVRAAALAAGLLGAALYRVPPGYYSTPLAARARTLRCPADRLCKTLVLENVALPAAAAPRTEDPLGRQRFIAVVLQYTTRLDVPALERALRAAHGAPGDLKLRAAERAPELTGFAHNAVSPLGSATPLPLVVTKPVAALPFVWLGGGAEDVKLRVCAGQLVRSSGAVVLDVAVARDGEDGDGDGGD